ncbi:MAG: elongation factor P [Elusimicrobiaceae bacterium]|nr:elongation factor P [Elusimicrobiaceae bacterium]
MISTSEFREGMLIEDSHGNILEILHYQNHRKSQARAVVRVKCRNLASGAVVEDTFRPEDKFKEVDVEKHSLVYMYTNGGKAVFMNNESYEQLEISTDQLGDTVKYLVENMQVEGLYINGGFFNILLPIKVELKVSSTVPGVKGDSVSNMTKPATLESGAEVKVPLFVNEGDTIRVDTRDGSYVERV